MMNDELWTWQSVLGLIFSGTIISITVFRRLTTTLRANRNARKLIRHSVSNFYASREYVVLVPVRGEPETAARAVEYWRAQHTSWYIVTSSYEDPPLTWATCQREPEHIIVTTGKTKAEMLNEAMGKIATAQHAKYALLFDSDSRPIGEIATHKEADCLLSASIYASPSTSVLARGCALWQTVWSFGFELQMPMRRHFWYLVGHGIGIRLTNQQLAAFRAGRGTEDLDLGYRLSTMGVAVEQIDIIDRCEWASVLDEVLTQVGRWFWGDVEAIIGNFSGQPLYAFIRLLELVVTWMLGPWLLLAALALVSQINFEIGLTLGGVIVLITLLPAAIMPRVTYTYYPVADYRLLFNIIVERVNLVPGLMARPFLDSFAIVRYVLRLGTGSRRRITPKHGGLDACI